MDDILLTGAAGSSASLVQVDTSHLSWRLGARGVEYSTKKGANLYGCMIAENDMIALSSIAWRGGGATVSRYSNGAKVASGLRATPGGLGCIRVSLEIRMKTS